MKKIYTLFLCITITFAHIVTAIEEKAVDEEDNDSMHSSTVTEDINIHITQEEVIANIIPSDNIVTPPQKDVLTTIPLPIDHNRSELLSSQEPADTPEENEKFPLIENHSAIIPDQDDHLDQKIALPAQENTNEIIPDPVHTTKFNTSIHLNEVLANPEEPDVTDEFIEIYNPTDEKTSLKNWQLYDKTGKDISNAAKRYIFDDVSIEKHALITVFKNKDLKFILNNTNEEIYLATPDGEVVSSYSYKNAQRGLSWNNDDTWYEASPTPNVHNSENPLTKEYPNIIINEILPNPSDNETQNEFIEIYNPFDTDISLKNWVVRDASLSGSYTITDAVISAKSYFTLYRSDFSFALNNSGSEVISLIAPNGILKSKIAYTSTRKGLSLNRAQKWYWAQPTPSEKNAIDVHTLSYKNLLLSEVLPNPSGNENTEEYIEIYNPYDTPIDLKNWILKDGSKTGSYVFTHNTMIQPHDYYTIYRDTFTFALNNSNETISLLAPNEKIMSAVSYTSSHEAVSYNYDITTRQWRWSKYLTPNAHNIFNNVPVITTFDIDDVLYKNVYAEFNAKAHDADNEKLKVRWDFGDGHKSYQWTTRHKYCAKGKFYGSLRIQDGSEEIIKNFIVTVDDYPKYDVSITKISPNPAGADTGNEYIVIKNKSKTKINLINWSIATGAKTKTLVNHPVHNDLIVKPSKTKIISSNDAAITLPNTFGVIEIRRPDGSIAYTKKYGDKNMTIPDNATYEKIDDLWQWVIMPDREKAAQTREIVEQALYNETIFSQQLLEQRIAYSAIYEREKSTLPKNKAEYQQNIFSFFHLLNHFINMSFFTINKKINNLVYNDTKIAQSPIYIIPTTKDPCANPHMPTQHMYTFCK